MRIYTVLVKANAEPALVRDGFSWITLILGPLWLAVHRAWIAAAVSLGLFVLITALVPDPARGILFVGVALMLGWIGHDLQRWALENRGYLLVHVLAARNVEEAFCKLLEFRPDLVRYYRPDLT